jgi:hypothetical protein
VVRGIVRDAATKDPVAGALVALLDTTATLVYGVSADVRGRYTLVVREPGIYAVVTTKAGYFREVSDWLTIAARDTFEVMPRLARPVTTLAPVLVEAQRDSLRALRVLGISLRNIGGTIVTPMEVDQARRGSRNVYDLVESLHVPTLRVKRMHVVAAPREYPGPSVLGDVTCVAYARTNRCVTVVVDGVRHASFADKAQLEQFISSQAVSYLVFLRPAEAGVLYGSGTSDGVLLIFTKSGATDGPGRQPEPAIAELPRERAQYGPC